MLPPPPGHKKIHDAGNRFSPHFGVDKREDLAANGD